MLTPSPSALALYWSRNGHVACDHHVPPADSDEWDAHHWRPIPAFSLERGIYQCEYCTGRPIGKPLVEEQCRSGSDT